MQEAEVSLRIALYVIRNEYTQDDVRVSLDGAHIKTGNVVHFDIYSFLSNQGCKKVSGPIDSWQGTYEVVGAALRIVISSTPGVGDVNVYTTAGEHLYIESKKGKEGNRSSSEYSLMREAIGQLMTGFQMTDNMVPVVAVPYTSKSCELANKWSQLKQIQNVGIRFMLVHPNGNVDYI